MRIRHLFFLLIIFTSCGEKYNKNISTSSALLKYQEQLEGKKFMAFPETRENPLKWYDSIPEKRLSESFREEKLKVSARPGEFFVFQAGVWALKTELSDLKIDFTDLISGDGEKIGAEKMTCFNSGGINIKGEPFIKTVTVPANRIQALWMGIDLQDAEKGFYTGTVAISSGGSTQRLDIALKVDGAPVPDHGYNDGVSMSRLNWLNSRAGIDNEVTRGYIPVRAEGNKLGILGRTITIADNGLPGSFMSYFESSNQSVGEKGEYIVNTPFRFLIEKQQGGIIRLEPGEVVFSERSDAGVKWQVINSSNEVDLVVTGHLEFDGFVEYGLKLTAKKPLKIKDIRLEIPVIKENAVYMMGLGHEGGYRSSEWSWKWDVSKNQDMLWTGSVNGGMRIKFYYTTRELTKNLPEFWAFYSLDGEIVYPGPGNESKTVINSKGPNDWLIKNLRENYIPAWYNVIEEGKFKDEIDLSVITTPDGRLNNFYVAGLEWMVRNIGIDGVYIDDSALDRFTLQRARKVIDRYRPEGRMDLHSWNHFNEWAGYTNCLNLYMDLLPYFDLVWIGEGRDYNRAPDHWLIEVSGIPFGLPGQMLEGGGNPWRGMVYGITNRAGWVGNTPVEIWKFWDEYKIMEKIMMGYWEENYPVISSNKSIVSSIFRGKDESILAVANWSDKDQKVSLSLKWRELGIDPARVEIFIPFIKDFQDAVNNVNLESIIVPGGKGFIVILKNKNK